MKTCPKCNCEYEDSQNFCKQDGTPLLSAGAKKCPKCGKTYDGDAAFCMVCGIKLVSASEKPTCSNCGAELPEGAAFCMKCGTKASPAGGAGAGVGEDYVLISGSGNPFYICKYEVTQKLWQSVMGNNPSKFKGENRPVEKVSWYDAVEFCNKLSEREGLTPCYSGSGKDTKCNFSSNGYRLPTKAEWGYAAEGGENYRYAGSNNIDEVAWSRGNSGSQTHDVGQKKPNGYGLYDMSGNVWEWCFDSSSGGGRYIRGGSWDRKAGRCGVSFMDFGYPDYRCDSLGFRLVRSV